MAGVDHGIKSQEFSFVPRFPHRQNRALNHVHANPSCGKISPTDGYSRPEWNSAGTVESRQKFKIQPPLPRFFPFSFSFISFFFFFFLSPARQECSLRSFVLGLLLPSRTGEKKENHVRAAFSNRKFFDWCSYARREL